MTGIASNRLRLRLGMAFGNSLSRSLAGREIAAFDALGAPFWFDLSGLAGTALQPSALGRLFRLMTPARNAFRQDGRGTRLTRAPYALAANRGDWRFGLYESPANAQSSLLNLAGNAATVTYTAPSRARSHGVCHGQPSRGVQPGRFASTTDVGHGSPARLATAGYARWR